MTGAPLTILEAFALSLDKSIADLRAEKTDTDAAVAKNERRIQNIQRLQTMLAQPTGSRLDAAE